MLSVLYYGRKGLRNDYPLFTSQRLRAFAPSHLRSIRTLPSYSHPPISGGTLPSGFIRTLPSDSTLPSQVHSHYPISFALSHLNRILPCICTLPSQGAPSLMLILCHVFAFTPSHFTPCHLRWHRYSCLGHGILTPCHLRWHHHSDGHSLSCHHALLRWHTFIWHTFLSFLRWHT